MPIFGDEGMIIPMSDGGASNYSRNFDSESTGAAGNLASGAVSGSTLWTIDDTVFYAGAKSIKISNNSVNIGQNWQYDTAQSMASGDFTLTFALRMAVTNPPDGGNRTGWMFRVNNAGSTGYAIMARPQSASATLRLAKFSVGSETSIVTATVLSGTYVADAWYKIKVTTLGTSIKAKIWLASDSEPGAWDIDTTDATYDNTNVKTGPYFFDGTTNLRYSYIDEVVVT